VSLLRPARTVSAPDGRRWEIYVSRFAPPRWTPGDYDSLADDYGGIPVFAFARVLVLLVLIEIPLFLVHNILLPLLRWLVTLPFAVVRGHRSGRIRVEAVSFFPWEESHLWTTTRDHVANVVEQVAAGLERGEVSKPLGAVFEGSQEMIAGSFRGLHRDDATGYRL
jgi:hypothetical protein